MIRCIYYTQEKLFQLKYIVVSIILICFVCVFTRMVCVRVCSSRSLRFIIPKILSVLQYAAAYTHTHTNICSQKHLYTCTTRLGFNVTHMNVCIYRVSRRFCASERERVKHICCDEMAIYLTVIFWIFCAIQISCKCMCEVWTCALYGRFPFSQIYPCFYDDTEISLWLFINKNSIELQRSPLLIGKKYDEKNTNSYWQWNEIMIQICKHLR